MMCGADNIDDVNVLRAGGTPRGFNKVYAPSTVGILLREFSFGHVNRLAAVAREHLIALAARTPVLAGADEGMFVENRLAEAWLRSGKAGSGRGMSAGSSRRSPPPKRSTRTPGLWLAATPRSAPRR